MRISFTHSIIFMLFFQAASAQNPQYFFANKNRSYSGSAVRMIQAGPGTVILGTSALASGVFPDLVFLDSALNINRTKQYINSDYSVTKTGTDADTVFSNVLFPQQILKTSSGFILTNIIDSSATIYYHNGVISGGNVIARAAVSKLNRQGGVVWNKKYISTQGFVLALATVIAQGSNYYAFGTIQQDNTLTYDLCMLKLDANGNIIWSKSFGGSGDDELFKTIQTSDGNFVMLAESYSFSSHRSVYLVKVKNDGTVLWSDAFNLSAFDYASDLMEIPHRELAVLASMTGSRTGLMLLKLSADGKLIWNKPLGSSTLDQPVAMQLLNNSQILLSGIVSSGSEDDEILFKCDTAGNVLWSKRIGEPIKIINGKPFNSNETDYSMLAVRNKILLGGQKLYFFEGSGGPPTVYATSYVVTTDTDGNTDCLDHDYVSYNDTYSLQSFAANTITKSISCFALDYAMNAQDTVFVRSNACSSGDQDENKTAESFSIPHTIIVVPNPMQHEFRISTGTESRGNISVSLLDLLGREVCRWNENLSNELQLPASVTPGFYYLQIETDSGLNVVPVIIQR